MKEQTSRCGELARTVGRASCTESTEKYTSECSDAMSTGHSVDTSSDSESELQDCSFVFAGSSDTVGTEMEPSGSYSSASEPFGTGSKSAQTCASGLVSTGLEVDTSEADSFCGRKRRKVWLLSEDSIGEPHEGVEQYRCLQESSDTRVGVAGKCVGSKSRPDQRFCRVCPVPGCRSRPQKKLS
jgi:hypothetical protein